MHTVGGNYVPEADWAIVSLLQPMGRNWPWGRRQISDGLISQVWARDEHVSIGWKFDGYLSIAHDKRICALVKKCKEKSDYKMFPKVIKMTFRTKWVEKTL